VLDANGKPLARIDPGYLSGGKLEWTAPASGRFYLRASSGGLRVKYSVLVSTPQTDPDPATVMTPGEIVRGQLETPGKAQRVRIDVEAGQSYTLDIRGESKWQMVATDGVYKLYEPIRAGCHTQVWTAQESGSYFIEFYAYWWGSLDRYTIGFSKYDGPITDGKADCDQEEDSSQPVPSESDNAESDESDSPDRRAPAAVQSPGDIDESGPNDESDEGWLRDDSDVWDAENEADWVWDG
jgi:hypothetical protein